MRRSPRLGRLGRSQGPGNACRSQGPGNARRSPGPGNACRSPGSPDARRPARRGLEGLAIVALTALVAGCLGGAPSPSVPIPTSTLPPLTATPAAADLLRLALPADPGGFTPAPADDAAAIVDGYVFAPLYRLDARLVPQPALAAAAANVSADGRTWSVPLKANLRFSDGSPLTATDVARTYQLALSPDCPFADLCKAVQAAVTSVATSGSQRAVFHLARPDAALGAEVLAQLGIVSGAALDASLARLLAQAADVDADSLTTLTDDIATATNADACLDAVPPSSCDLATYTPRLEAILRPTGIALPEPALLLGADGKPDASAYGAALYAQAQALTTALGAAGTDRLAAAFPLLDLRRAPVASGPFRVAAYDPGTSLDLVRWQPAPQGAPARIHVAVMPDPAVAATALETGDLDWLPELGSDQVAAVAAQSGLRAALRPSSTLRAIVFNVRAGHPYADPAARLAFATCVDRAGDLDTATGGQGILAQGPVPVGSWAAASDPGWPAYDPARARGLLTAAGWQPGPDGIMSRGGLRLSSQLIVRTGRPDLLAFATAAAEQLRTCGIDLRVLSQDPSGQLLLAQLEYPNTFDTVLVADAAGPDPDAGLGLFHSRHITTAENPADGNIGGWSDPDADTLIEAALASPDTTTRGRDYQQLQRLLAQQVPILPISWDPQAAAVSQRLRLGDDPIDPSRPGYDAARLQWTLAP